MALLRNFETDHLVIELARVVGLAIDHHLGVVGSGHIDRRHNVGTERALVDDLAAPEVAQSRHFLRPAGDVRFQFTNARVDPGPGVVSRKHFTVLLLNFHRQLRELTRHRLKLKRIATIGVY